MVIYRLLDPETKEVRYIGVASNYKQRLISHIAVANNGRAKHRPGYKPTHCENWVRSLVQRGFRPSIEVVEHVTSDNWAERECYWIKHYREMGCKLTNLTDGGEGTYGHRQTEEVKAKHGAAVRRACADPGVIERKRISAIGHLVSQETRDKIAARARGRKQSEESKIARSKISKERISLLRVEGVETKCALPSCHRTFRKVQISQKYCSRAHTATAGTRAFRMRNGRKLEK